MRGAAPVWGLIILFLGISSCAPSSSDPATATTSGETPTIPGDKPTVETQASSDTQTMTESDAPGDSTGVTSGLSEIAPGLTEAAETPTLVARRGLVPLSGQHKFVRSGKFLGCLDLACETVVLHTEWQVELVEAATGQMKTSYRIPGTGYIGSVELLAGKIVVFDELENLVNCLLLDAQTGQLIQKIQIPHGLTDVAASDHFIAVSDGRTHQIEVWGLQPPGEKPLLTLEGKGTITFFAMSDSYVAAYDRSGTLSIWKLPSGELLSQEVEVESVTAMVIAEQRLAFATFDAITAVTKVNIYDLNQHKITASKVGYELDRVTALTLVDNQIMFGVQHPGKVGLWVLDEPLSFWNTHKAKQLQLMDDQLFDRVTKIIRTPTQWVVGCAQFPANDYSRDYALGFLDAKGHLQKTLTFPSTVGWAFALRGDILVEGGEVGVTFWDVLTGKEIVDRKDQWLTNPLLANVRIRSMYIDGPYLVIGGASRVEPVLVANMDTGETLAIMNIKNLSSYFVRDSILSGNILAVLGYSKSITLWDTPTGNYLGTLEGHTGDISSLKTWDHFLVSASEDLTMRIWDLTSKTQIGMIQETGEFVYLHDMDKNYVVYERDDALVLRDWKTGNVVQSIPLISEKALLSVIIFDSFLISCGEDSMVRIWDIKSGELLTTYETDSVYCVLDRSRTDQIRLAGGAHRDRIEVLEIDPKTLEGRVLASETPKRLAPLQTFKLTPKLRPGRVTLIDHRSWFRRTWDQIKTWIQKLF